MTSHHPETTPDFAAQMDELRALIAHFSGEIPAKSATTLDWLNAVRGGWQRPIAHPRLALFAGTHGTATHAEQNDFHNIMNNTNRPDGRLGGLCKLANTDLRIYELDLAHPTADTATGPAMTDEALVMSTSYGMMAVEPDLDLLLATATGAGMTTSIEKILYHPATTDSLTLLRDFGGYELCALLGLTLAAALAKKPLLLEGTAGLCIATLLYRANPASIAHTGLIVDAEAAQTAQATLPISIFTRTLAMDAPGAALAAETTTLRQNELLLRPVA